MRFESQRVRPVNDYFGGAILIRNVYRPRSIFPPKPGIGAHKLAALLLFLPSSLPPSPTPFGAKDDGQSQGKGSNKSRSARSLPQAIFDEILILVDESNEDVFGRRTAKGGLHSHISWRVTSIRNGPAGEATWPSVAKGLA